MGLLSKSIEVDRPLLNDFLEFIKRKRLTINEDRDREITQLQEIYLRKKEENERQIDREFEESKHQLLLKYQNVGLKYDETIRRLSGERIDKDGL